MTHRNLAGHAHAAAAAVAALALVVLTACGDSPTGPRNAADPITSLPRNLTSAEVELISASNRFAFDLAREVAHPDSSFFISPLSASMALGMTLNGADGNTFDEMRAVLGFEGMTQAEINQSHRSLIPLLLELDPTVETVLANSAWIRSGFNPFDAFTDVLRTDFSARVAVLDFDDLAAVDTMNAWASEATNGRIDDIIVPPIDPNTVMFLMNALFFKGTWTTQFDPADTRLAPFRSADGRATDVPMMLLRDVTLPFAETDRYSTADLPYGGGAFAMTVVVPHGGESLDAFIAGLGSAEWAALVGGLSEAEIEVAIPRFTMEYERSFDDDLKALGMLDAFDELRADFSRIAPIAPGENLWVEEVKQKAFVEVNEDGTEAAAVTSVEIAADSAIPALRADRPFLFAIRERLSGTILFLGAVVEAPEAPGAPEA